MIGRRAILGAAAAMAVRPTAAAVAVSPVAASPVAASPVSASPVSASGALPVPAGNELTFRMIRHGSDIGRHGLTFEQQGDTLTVRIAVDAVVTLLSVPIVRYSHHAVEVWKAGMLSTITGETNKNGEHEWIKASRNSEGLEVLGSQTERYIAPEPAGGASYWNRRLLDGPMISLEDGVLLHPNVVQEAAESIPLASGGTVRAKRYKLSGSFKINLWYDETNTWASLGLSVKDGSYVHYERL
jgi:hypothetical protein